MPQRTSQWVGEVEAADEGGSHRSGFFAMPAVSAGDYVRSIAVRTRFSC
jgi:hypothetical protein